MDAGTQMESYAAAEADASHALAIDPSHIKARHRRGLAWRALGKLQLAMDDLQTVLQALPGNTQLLADVEGVRAELANAAPSGSAAPLPPATPTTTTTTSTAFNDTAHPRSPPRPAPATPAPANTRTRLVVEEESDEEEELSAPAPAAKELVEEQETEQSARVCCPTVDVYTDCSYAFLGHPADSAQARSQVHATRVQYIQAVLERAASRLTKGQRSSALADLQLLAAVAPESAYVQRQVAAEMAATTEPDRSDDQGNHRRAPFAFSANGVHLRGSCYVHKGSCTPFLLTERFY